MVRLHITKLMCFTPWRSFGLRHIAAKGRATSHNVKIMGVRVLNAVGEGTTANIVSGINFAVSKGAKVINMSLGGNQSDTAFPNAITNAQNNGVLVVVAAG